MAAAPFVLSLTNNTNKHDAGQAANAILQVFRMTWIEIETSRPALKMCAEPIAPLNRHIVDPFDDYTKKSEPNHEKWNTTASHYHVAHVCGNSNWI